MNKIDAKILSREECSKRYNNIEIHPSLTCIEVVSETEEFEEVRTFVKFGRKCPKVVYLFSAIQNPILKNRFHVRWILEVLSFSIQRVLELFLTFLKVAKNYQLSLQI